MRLHRYLMEQKLGRKLNSNEIVHHIDGNKFNNDINNLELLNRSAHAKEHKENLEKARIVNKKYEINYDEVFDLYVTKRLSAQKISNILQIPLTTINWFIRKSKIERPNITCKICGDLARYPSKKLCYRCYQREYQRNYRKGKEVILC